jgi:hypothetical protein
MRRNVTKGDDRERESVMLLRRGASVFQEPEATI